MRITSMKAFFFLSLLFFAGPSMATDTIFPGQTLSGNQTIRSDGGTFELGFFTPGNSSNYYIGMWYGRLPTKTVVWVANRDQPLSDPSSSTLQLFVGLTYSALSLNFFGQKERNAFLALYLDTETRRAIVGSW